MIVNRRQWRNDKGLTVGLNVGTVNRNDGSRFSNLEMEGIGTKDVNQGDNYVEKKETLDYKRICRSKEMEYLEMRFFSR